MTVDMWHLPPAPVVHPRKARVTCVGGPRDGVVLPVTAGTVTVDRSSDVRRTGTLAVAGLTEWTPDDAADALDPRAGTELLVEQMQDGVWVPQGIFTPSKPKTSRSPDGLQITVDVDDRSYRVKLAGMDRRWVVAAGTPVSAAIRGILTQITPWLPCGFPDTDQLVVGDVLIEFGDDPWAACLDLAESAGLDLYVDTTGTVQTASATAALSATPIPVTWLSVDRDIDASQVINHVRAEWTPVRPDPAPDDWDDTGGFEDAVDDWSTTSVLSWVGRRCKLVKGDSSLLTSPAAAQQAAQIELLQHLDIAYSGAGTIAPDSSLDVGTVTLLDADRYRITRLDIDLAGGPTSVTLGIPPVGLDALIAQALQIPGDTRTREIVTSTDPLRTVLASDPTGSEVSVTPTAAVAGVQVGDVVEVLHSGKGERIAVAAVSTSVPSVVLVHGNAQVTGMSTGVTKSVSVTFDTPFASAPDVVVTPSTGAPDNVTASASGVSASGFTINANRKDATTSVTVFWVAAL